MAYDEGGVNYSMPVAPAYGGGGFGGFGGDSWAWIIILLMCGWGGMGFGGGGFGGGYDFPWILNGQNGINNNVSGGFRDAMLNDGITSIGDKIGDISTQLCGGFAGVTASVTGAQNALAQQLYTNQIADLERSFAAQTANTAGLTNLSSQLATCCCENRAATQDVKYTIATEACANRATSTANTQAILDKLCQMEIDNLKSENENLRSMVNMQNLAASQAAQTAALIADNTEQTKYIVNRVAPYPIPAYTVANPITPAII